VRLGADFDLAPLLAPGGALSFGGITNGAYSEANTAYLSTSDADRSAAAKELLRLVADNAPIIPVCFEKHEVCAHRGIVGGLAPTQSNIFQNMPAWTINLK
jgi:ABC-type oligopeptide transport system substrate-binding subunit